MPGAEPTQIPDPAKQPEVVIGSAQPGLQVEPLPERASTLVAEPGQEVPGVMPPTTEAVAEAGEIAAQVPVTPATQTLAEKDNMAMPPTPLDSAPDATSTAEVGPLVDPQSHVGEPIAQEESPQKGLWDRVLGVLKGKQKPMADVSGVQPIQKLKVSEPIAPVVPIDRSAQRQQSADSQEDKAA